MTSVFDESALGFGCEEINERNINNFIGVFVVI